MILSMGGVILFVFGNGVFDIFVFLVVIGGDNLWIGFGVILSVGIFVFVFVVGLVVLVVVLFFL